MEGNKEKIKSKIKEILDQYQFCSCYEGDLFHIRDDDINDAAEEITDFVIKLLKHGRK